MAQLLSNLPIGAKVKFGKYSVNGETAQPITWLVVAKNHSGYPSNSATLLTSKVIDYRVWDTIEPNYTNSIRRSFGNNNYKVSNIDQWLNSDKNPGEWYTAQHSYDEAPTPTHLTNGEDYAGRPGFLNLFSQYEKAAILNTSLPIVVCNVDKVSNNSEIITRKVFLPSIKERYDGAINGYSDGVIWEYFSNNNAEVTTITQQAYDNSTYSGKTLSQVTTNCYYWLRSISDITDDYEAKIITTPTTSVYYHDKVKNVHGVRPALNLSSTIKVSDTTDNEGCYTVIWNTAPTQPHTINAPTIYGGKSNAISWDKATDPDGDALTYQLECSINGGEYTQIYSGTATTYAHLVPFGTTSVAYRVKATDPAGESSAYTTSATKTVVNNNAPVISGTDANLGVKSSGFTGTYTVTDANNNTVTVTEAIDGVQIRSLVATLGEEITYGVTENTWLALPNGSHTLTIRATDGIDTSVRTYTFTKLVDSFTIRNSTPWVADTMPTRIMLVVTRNIPSAATFKVEVCNNGYDATPTWEDCTDAVKSGLVHVFTNTTKSATNWGVLVRVTVERNGAAGACYISAIGGNFE